MTRALLTAKFCETLNKGYGVYIAVDAGGLTASLYRDTFTSPEPPPLGTWELKCVGKLSYSANSVDYDLLQLLLKEAA